MLAMHLLPYEYRPSGRRTIVRFPYQVRVLDLDGKVLFSQTWTAEDLDGEVSLGQNNQGVTPESLRAENPIPYREGLAELRDILRGRIVITLDPIPKLRPLGLKVRRRYLCDLARFEGLRMLLPTEAYPHQKSDAVSLRVFRTTVLHLPPGPDITPIAEAAENELALFRLVAQDWWEYAEDVSWWEYPKGAHDYGADDLDERPNEYEWRYLLPRGSGMPPPASVGPSSTTGKRAAERKQSSSPPHKRECGVQNVGVFGTGPSSVAGTSTLAPQGAGPVEPGGAHEVSSSSEEGEATEEGEGEAREGETRDGQRSPHHSTGHSSRGHSPSKSKTSSPKKHCP